jgi:hypothetical protein
MPLFKKYERWVQALGQEIGKEAMWIQQRPDLSPVDLIDVSQVLEGEKLALNAAQTDAKYQSEFSEEYAFLTSCIKPLQAFPPQAPTDTELKKDEVAKTRDDQIRKSLGCYLYYKYNQQLLNFVNIDRPQPINMGEKTFYIPIVRSKGVMGFLSWAEEINKRSQKPVVMAVEPKESVQNISDVASREQLLTLAAGLNAALS